MLGKKSWKSEERIVSGVE